MVRIMCPKCHSTLEIPDQNQPIVSKPLSLNGGFGCPNDVCSVTNLTSDAEKEKGIRQFLNENLNRTPNSFEGYTNLAHLERGVGNKNAAVSERQRQMGFV